MPILRVDEKCQLYYAYSIFNIGGEEFYEDIPLIVNPISVPK